MKYLFQILLLPFLLTGVAYTQDLHFSQHYHAFQNVNPALAGVMKPDYRVSAIYRSQWQSVPVPYLTFVGSFDMKYYLPGHDEGFFGGGLIFNYDQSGDAKWTLSQLGLTLNYSRALSDQNIITAGFQVSGGQRSLDISQLTFANQHNGERFDPFLPTKEFNLNANGFSYVDLAAGFNWNFVSQGRGLGQSSGNLGLGIFHINRPAQDIYQSVGSKIPFRFTLYANGWITLDNVEKFDFYLSTQAQMMGAYNEVILGGDVRYYLSGKEEDIMALSLGVHYRMIGLNDAFFPTIKLYYKDWTFGFSYDVNISEFSVATQRRGGPEITAIYTVSKVKPLPEFRACPLF